KDLRIPNMRGIMTARSKPLQVLEASESDTATQAIKFVKPAGKSSVKLVDSVDELVHLLHNEAKAI
ncbi:electron transfer flavoprotein beta subunit/FixA family protein, partial [Schleiferiaceae bacterium]|nr:electron transfer flavoprotein beta subunit/FixA family protein [Schleiferiaceae bacterium]